MPTMIHIRLEDDLHEYVTNVARASDESLARIVAAMLADCRARSINAFRLEPVEP